MPRLALLGGWRDAPLEPPVKLVASTRLSLLHRVQVADRFQGAFFLESVEPGRLHASDGDFEIRHRDSVFCERRSDTRLERLDRPYRLGKVREPKARLEGLDRFCKNLDLRLTRQEAKETRSVVLTNVDKWAEPNRKSFGIGTLGGLVSSLHVYPMIWAVSGATWAQLGNKR